MNIKIINEVFTIKNSAKQIDAVFELINKKIQESQLQVLFLVIDGVHVNDGFYAYFQEHIDTIKEVEVVCDSLSVLVNETVMSAYQYIKKAIPALKMLAEKFYQSTDINDFNNLADLFEGIGWLVDTQNRIDQIANLDLLIKDYQLWNRYVKNIKQIVLILPELEQALKQRDYVLIGDLLTYEVVPEFENCLEQLGFLTPAEGDHYAS